MDTTMSNATDTAIPVPYTQDYRDGFAHGRDVGIATKEIEHAKENQTVMLIKGQRLRADATLIAAAPQMLQTCVLLLARLDMEASENAGHFPCRAYRNDLRKIIEAATGKARPSPYADA